MTPARTAKIFICGASVVWLSLAARQAAQSALSITPANPTISIGGSQVFTTNEPLVAAAVSAGGEYTCIRRPDGTAQCAGRNQFGQLGDGDVTDVPVLVQVAGLTTVARVIAGDEFACALLADGTAKCWGLGESGQRDVGRFRLTHRRAQRRGERADGRKPVRRGLGGRAREHLVERGRQIVG